MKGCKTVFMKKNAEEDGVLYVMEHGREVPFPIERIFLVANVKPGRSRGDHATRETRLILFPVSGSCTVVADNGAERESFRMDDPSRGLLVEPMVWRSMRDFTPDCVMMAVCDRPFAPGRETIDDYEAYLKAVRAMAEGK